MASPFFSSAGPEFLIKASQCENSRTGAQSQLLSFCLRLKLFHFLVGYEIISYKCNFASSCIQTSKCILKLKLQPTNLYTSQTNKATKKYFRVALQTQSLWGPNVRKHRSQFDSTVTWHNCMLKSIYFWPKAKMCRIFMGSAGISICLVCIAVSPSAFFDDTTETRHFKHIGAF